MQVFLFEHGHLFRLHFFNGCLSLVLVSLIATSSYLGRLLRDARLQCELMIVLLFDLIHFEALDQLIEGLNNPRQNVTVTHQSSVCAALTLMWQEKLLCCLDELKLLLGFEYTVIQYLQKLCDDYT